MEISQNLINFVQKHATDDVNALRLKYNGQSTDDNHGFPIDVALTQIEARKKARKKIPTFIDNPSFIFPDTLSAEQATNEIVARYHASLLTDCRTILDMSAGLGIDVLTFAQSGISVTACEINELKSEALKHNAKELKLDHMVSVHTKDSLAFLNNSNRKFDAVFADPARRSSDGKRLHALADCQPDVITSMEAIMRVTDRFLIKCSPLLDLTLIRGSIDNLSHIYIICLKGECKEVLIDIHKGSVFSGITVADLDKYGLISNFECPPLPANHDNPVDITSRKDASEYGYLYEPNAGVMKTGAWWRLTAIFPALQKADSNTHLFLSDMLYKEFPGRIIKIEEQPDKKTLKSYKGNKCNVVGRNHPLPASTIASKYGLIPGGENYLYAFRYNGKPVYLIGKEVKECLRVQELPYQKEE